MDGVVKTVYTIFVYSSVITVCFAPFGLICSSQCLKTVHFNLRFLIFTLGIMWCIFPIGGTLFFLVLEADENFPLLYQKIEYLIARNICAISGYSFRIIETSICIERLFATIYFETYESSKTFRVFSVFATFFTIVISTSFSILFNVLHVSPYVIYVFLITVETTNIILFFILQKQNHKLRKMSNSVEALLSSKYQLIENIKSLNILFPQAAISFVLSNFALVATIVLRLFINEALAPPFYYTIYNFNVIIISLYWINRTPWFKMKFIKVRKYFSNRLNFSSEIEILKVTTVKTALGQNVQVQQTVEDYFKNLDNAWK